MKKIGTTSSNMKKIVWKVWAPPKCKFFAWLIIQNRVWTADRLRRRGLPNCDLCPLCKQTGETAAHLLFQCRFAKRIWYMVKDWLHLLWLDRELLGQLQLCPKLVDSYRPGTKTRNSRVKRASRNSTRLDSNSTINEPSRASTFCTKRVRAKRVESASTRLTR